MDGPCLVRHFEECRLPLDLLDSNPYRATGRLVRHMKHSKWVWEDPPGGPGFFADVRTEGRDEKFVLFVGDDHEVEILDESRERRHILLMTRSARSKRRYLFGHDERHLFVLKLPGDRAKSLEEALEELKPASVVRAQNERREILRQGEWFFVPAPDFAVPKDCVIRRKTAIFGGRNPHVADELVRVRIRDRMNSWLNATYVRGKVRHRDHETLELEGWHRVHGNTQDRTTITLGFCD